MPEFTRSRLKRTNNSEEQLTKKTVVVGLVAVGLLVCLFAFGLPILIRFSIFLGSQKKDDSVGEVILPPLPPRLVLPFEATKSADLTVKGYSEPGVSVELYLNNELAGTVQTDDKGEFSVGNLKLSFGQNVVSGVAFLKETVKSERSKPVLILLDNVAPELTLTNPSEDSVKVDSSDFDITGKTEKGASVTVNNSIANVGDDGNFKLKMQLSPGKNEYEVKAKDLAGNETKKKITITYDI